MFNCQTLTRFIPTDQTGNVTKYHDTRQDQINSIFAKDLVRDTSHTLIRRNKINCLSLIDDLMFNFIMLKENQQKGHAQACQCKCRLEITLLVISCRSDDLITEID